MANNLSEMVWMYDMDRRLDSQTKACERVTGYSPEEFAKEGPIFWMHGSDRARMSDHWTSLFEGAAYRDEEYRLVTKDARTDGLSRHGGRFTTKPVANAVYKVASAISPKNV